MSHFFDSKRENEQKSVKNEQKTKKIRFCTFFPSILDKTNKQIKICEKRTKNGEKKTEKKSVKTRQKIRKAEQKSNQIFFLGITNKNP
jgi:hypothetical protein